MLPVPHGSAQLRPEVPAVLNIVFPRGLQPQRQSSRSECECAAARGEHLSCLPWPVVGLGERPTPVGGLPAGHCVPDVSPRPGSWLLPGSRVWRFSLHPDPVYPGCARSLEEGAEECGAGICVLWLSAAQTQGLFFTFSLPLCFSGLGSWQCEAAAGWSESGEQTTNPEVSYGAKICVMKRNAVYVERGIDPASSETKFARVSGVVGCVITLILLLYAHGMRSHRQTRGCCSLSWLGDGIKGAQNDMHMTFEADNASEIMGSVRCG